MAAYCLFGRIEQPLRREVHRPAPDAGHEVGDDRAVWLALDDHALEVLVAARADQFKFDAVHDFTGYWMGVQYLA